MPKAKRTYKKTAKGGNSGLGKYVVSGGINVRHIRKVRDYILDDRHLYFDEKLLLICVLDMILYNHTKKGG